MASDNAITIECHGALEQLCGRRAIQIQPEPTPLTVSALIDELSRHNPRASALLSRSAVARGDQLLHRGQQLAPGDCVALLPPVSGG